MDPRKPKDNANPTVLSVPASRRRGRRNQVRTPLGQDYVARYNFRDFTVDDCDGRGGGWGGSDDDDDDDDGGGTAPPFGLGMSLAATASERSAHLALSAAAAVPSAGPDPVGILRAGGFVLPTAATARRGALDQPAFVPAVSPGSTDGSGGGGAGSVPPASAVGSRDGIDAEEVFEMIRNVRDPEHPLSLEQLGVVRMDHVSVVDAKSGRDRGEEGGERGGSPSPSRRPKSFSLVDIRFTPTIPHCSMATLIGLTLRVKLLRSLPRRFKVTVRIEPGTHASENAVNRQLGDKERVAAALENDNLRGVVDKCIADGMRGLLG